MAATMGSFNDRSSQYLLMGTSHVKGNRVPVCHREHRLEDGDARSTSFVLVQYSEREIQAKKRYRRQLESYLWRYSSPRRLSNLGQAEEHSVKNTTISPVSMLTLKRRA